MILFIQRTELQIRCIKWPSVDSSCVIPSPNPMFDPLLESSRWDDSNKGSNIGFAEEMSTIEIKYAPYLEPWENKFSSCGPVPQPTCGCCCHGYCGLWACIWAVWGTKRVVQRRWNSRAGVWPQPACSLSAPRTPLPHPPSPCCWSYPDNKYTSILKQDSFPSFPPIIQNKTHYQDVSVKHQFSQTATCSVSSMISIF